RIANPEEMNPLGISPSKAEAIQIETNRGLYMNEGTFKKTGRFDSTKSDISKTLETISRHKPNL
ncbi:MAG: hypothetical protein QF632_03990, partial [Candidatus Woesearchaeota archaeon]|nr:hypothetical protein [Candidatus Woesearchaeota archaeon]